MGLLSKYARLLTVIALALGVGIFAANHTSAIKNTSHTNLTTAESQYRGWAKAVQDAIAERGETPNKALVSLQQRRQRFDDLLSQQVDQINWRIHPLLALPQVSELDADKAEAERAHALKDAIARTRLKIRASRQWGDVRLNADIGADFDSVGNSGGLSEAEALLRLDLVQRLFDAVDETGVQRVTALKLDQQPPRSWSNRLYSLNAGAEGKAPFIRSLLVKLDVQSDWQSLSALMTHLQQSRVDGVGGRAMVLVEFSLNNPEGSRNISGMLEASLTLAVCLVSRDAELAPRSVEELLNRAGVSNGDNAGKADASSKDESGFGQNTSGSSGRSRDRGSRRRR